ncbi:dihydropteroate synthase [Aerococcus kribbianus]|uniref:Dihydropteroate synthase n=1 Tax=Aerococcus kribbianus TaxID=2999064 RepID=A0A9X3JFR3_9LACT|nr:MULTISPECIES: dihydropteroate synthase [unclassified Aerococcus]MCZ0717934.1 dihydropteroate synthase [Aerococcus sp. YH-aer221]MCZ0726221.1 dihydropteroate synthase [Aerococcus sp. YH-aer222]
MEAEQVIQFACQGRTISHGQETILCGIVNVTPDSFSDGGKWFATDKALQRATDLIAQGCQMIDIGGESTRPGSSYVEIEAEINRIVPVIRGLRAQYPEIFISVDTWKAQVAEAAIAAGADIINDITGLLGDPNMAATIAKSNAGAIIMANPVIVRPDHPSSKIFPTFGAEGVFSAEELAEFAEMDVPSLLRNYFQKSLAYADQAGLNHERIMLDPGVGFGFTKRENYQAIKFAPLIHEWGFTCFLGVSRKRFIQNTLGEIGVENDVSTEAGFAHRDQASAVLTAIAAYQGIEVVRVHAAHDHRIAQSIANHVRLANQVEAIDFPAYQDK